MLHGYNFSKLVFFVNVKVKFNLNTLSEWSHKRSRVHETLLEELWKKKEHGQYCLTIIVLLFCLCVKSLYNISRAKSYLGKIINVKWTLTLS